MQQIFTFKTSVLLNFHCLTHSALLHAMSCFFVVFCFVVVLCCVVVCCIVLFVQLASARGVVHCSMRQRPDPACHSADGVQLNVVNYIIVQPAYSVHCHPVKCSVE